MGIRDIPRSAVDGAVKLTRLPLDIVVSMLPGNGNGSATKPAAGFLPPPLPGSIDTAMSSGRRVSLTALPTALLGMSRMPI